MPGADFTPRCDFATSRGCGASTCRTLAPGRTLTGSVAAVRLASLVRCRFSTIWSTRHMRRILVSLATLALAAGALVAPDPERVNAVLESQRTGRSLVRVDDRNLYMGQAGNMCRVAPLDGSAPFDLTARALPVDLQAFGDALEAKPRPESVGLTAKARSYSRRQVTANQSAAPIRGSGRPRSSRRLRSRAARGSPGRAGAGTSRRASAPCAAPRSRPSSGR